MCERKKNVIQVDMTAGLKTRKLSPSTKIAIARTERVDWPVFPKPLWTDTPGPDRRPKAWWLCNHRGRKARPP